MRWYFVVLLIVIIALIVFISIVYPEFWSKAWLFFVGLAGTIIAFFKKISSNFSSYFNSGSIEAKNEEIKKELQTIKDKMAAIDAELAKERAKNKQEIERLTLELQMVKAETEALENVRKTIRKMSYDEYYNSLTEEEKSKMHDEAWNQVVFQ